MIWMEYDNETEIWFRLRHEPDFTWINRRETTKWMLVYYRQVPEEIVFRYEAALKVVKDIGDEIEKLPQI